MLYVNLQKAYDSVPLSTLWETLEKTNINDGIIKAVEKLYDDTRAKIKIQGRTIQGFTVTKGLKQGCCLLPTLLKIYLEQAFKLWKKKYNGMGIPLNNEHTLYTLCFTDDQVVFA